MNRYRASMIYYIRLLVCGSVVRVVVFFFKHKTAYEMRISDWSSDVCSSDLPEVRRTPPQRVEGNLQVRGQGLVRERAVDAKAQVDRCAIANVSQQLLVVRRFQPVHETGQLPSDGVIHQPRSQQASLTGPRLDRHETLRQLVPHRSVHLVAGASGDSAAHGLHETTLDRKSPRLNSSH